MYNEDGTPALRADRSRWPRPPGSPTPCHTCPKIPTGEVPIRENARELTSQLAKAYRHYRQCKALGRFPVQEWGEDEILADNAVVISDVERLVEDHGRKRLELVMVTAMTVGVAGGGGGGR